MCVCVCARTHQTLSLDIIPQNCLPYLLRQGTLVQVSIAVNGHLGHGNSYKGKYLVEAAYNFRGSVLYHHGGEHSGPASRHGVGEVTESPTSCRKQEVK